MISSCLRFTSRPSRPSVSAWVAASARSDSLIFKISSTFVVSSSPERPCFFANCQARNSEYISRFPNLNKASMAANPLVTPFIQFIGFTLPPVNRTRSKTGSTWNLLASIPFRPRPVARTLTPSRKPVAKPRDIPAKILNRAAGRNPDRNARVEPDKKS